MLTTLTKADLEAEVWECLARVNDPELDESLTELGFVETVAVSDDQQVEVGFRLPTYWCSPNFAFLMAFGIRREIEMLSWVKSIRVELHDHCFGDEVNVAVNNGRAFQEVFAQYCDGADLGAVIEKFQIKAFDRRQEAVILELRRHGLSAQQIVSMTLCELDRVEFRDDEAIKQKPRYRDLLLSRKLAERSEDPAFLTWGGKRLLSKRCQNIWAAYAPPVLTWSSMAQCAGTLPQPVTKRSRSVPMVPRLWILLQDGCRQGIPVQPAGNGTGVILGRHRAARPRGEDRRIIK